MTDPFPFSLDNERIGKSVMKLDILNLYFPLFCHGQSSDL